MYSAFPVEQANRRAVGATEFGLQPVSWLAFAGQLDHQRVNAHENASDVLGTLPIRHGLRPHFRTGVDYGMDDDAAGEWFEAIVQNLPLPAGAIHSAPRDGETQTKLLRRRPHSDEFVQTRDNILLGHSDAILSASFGF